VGAVGAASVADCVASAPEASSTRVANFAVAETPWTPLTARIDCANDEEEDDATTTEIAGHDETTRPPAAVTERDAPVSEAPWE
jgi:hypothetical protein